MEDINVKNTRNVKSEAPPDTAFLSKYRKLPFLLSSSFMLEHLRTGASLFFLSSPPPRLLSRDGCGNGSRAYCSGDFASSGIFLFGRIKRACHAKRDRIDAFLINSTDGREKEVTEKNANKRKTCDTPPEVSRPTRSGGSDAR